jgi:predicted nucleic acid-binding protein
MNEKILTIHPKITTNSAKSPRLVDAPDSLIAAAAIVERQK